LQKSNQKGGCRLAKRVIARFVGTNGEFKKYLETLRASEVVSLGDYRQKKKPAPRQTKEKLSTQV
jgi:rRNA processing protein Krr1/Pno1